MEKSTYAKGHFIFCLGGCPFLNLLTKDGMDYIENAELLEKLDLVVDGKLKGILIPKPRMSQKMSQRIFQ